jgi:hypothetical protein
VSAHWPLTPSAKGVYALGMRTAASIYFVIPCGAAKADHATAAADLYTGSAFAHTLRAAQAEAAATERDLGATTAVLILSAKYGLLALDDVVAPYDVKMGQPDSIGADALTAQAAALGIDYDTEVYALLPAAYRERLTAALDALDVAVQDVYEAAPGIGYQRGVASSVLRSADTLAA